MSDTGLPPLEGELQRLRSQVDDLSSALHAIRSGDVDVLVRDDSGVLQLYSRTSADRPYRLIVEEMGEGAATVSPEGRILFANQRLAELLGRERSALIGLPLSDLVAADGLEDLNALLAVIPGQTLRQPLELRRADGVAVPVLASMSALAIEGQAVRCLIAADLAPIREAERALTASELSFRMLVLNSQDGILNLAWQSGVITLVNPCLCRLLGREEAELIGRRLWEIGAFLAPPPAQELFERIQASESLHLDDITLQSATGERREVEFFSNVYLVGEERVIQCNIRDITDRKAAERLAHQRQAEVLQSLQDIVAALVALSETRDPYTAGHQSRVADLAVAIARELGLDADQQEGIRFSGLVHDIGKFSIPSEILTKPSALKPAEFDLLRTHVDEGYNVLAPIHFPWPVAEAVRQHHERLDGSGYPRGLRGEDIGLWGRILAVADTVEAMATHRPYRFSAGIDSALAEIQAGRGSRYDTGVVEACLKLFRQQGYQLIHPAP